MNTLLSPSTAPPVTLPVMAHLVLGYPSLSESLKSAEQYIHAGVDILELQIPFSHPTADGPVITLACQKAVEQGVTVQDCLGAIEKLRGRFPHQEIMVMSYVNRIYAFGFEAFAGELSRLEVKHLIVPDLPVDSGYAAAIMQPQGLKLVPVLAANTPDARLGQLLDLDFDFFYLMSDFKITGSGFSLHPRLKDMIQMIRRANGVKRRSKTRIGIGFGISTPAQARLVATEADVAIIGSALIQAQKTGKLEEYLESLRQVFHPNA